LIQSILRGSLTAWLLLATATPPPATAAQQAPQAFEPAPCPRATVREFEDERRLTCGFLSVLEDRTQPNGPRIKLNVVRVKAVSPRPAEDPVIMLAGGPGEGLGDLVPLLFGEDAPLEPLLADRDWIVLDQRGTGRSQPALDCPELTNLSAPEQLTRVSDEDPTSGRVVALRLCRERLAAAGVNLSAYNTVENAADVAALRTALGIKSFNLYAESYGTRLALAIVRDHPDGLRSLILDSTYPLQAGLNPVLATNYSRALNRVFDRCDADPGCSAGFPTYVARSKT